MYMCATNLVRRFGSLLVAFVLANVAVGATVAAADPTLTLSKNSDFSTEDALFEAEDMLYMQVTVGDALDLEATIETSVQLEPLGEGEAYETTLADQGDGTFTAGVAIADLNGAPGLWSIEIELSDGTNEIDLAGEFVVAGGDDQEEEEEEEEEEESDEEYDVVVVGTLEIEGDVYAVGDVSFALSPEVLIRMRGDLLDVTALLDGMRVLVKANDVEGTLTALEIRLLENRREGRWFTGKVSGEVEVLSDAEVTVAGEAFAITEQTEIRGGAGKELEVGDPVKVFYLQNADESLVALRIIIQEEDEGEDGEVEVEGVVTAVGETSITVEGAGELLVDAETEILGQDKAPIALADVNVGDVVEVKAVTTEAGLLAVRIKVEDAVVIEAEVESESEGQIVVAGMPLLLTGETLVLGNGNVVLSLASLRPGVLVSVQAVAEESAGKTAAKTYVAETILVKSDASATRAEDRAQPRSFELRGNYPNPFNPSTTITFETFGSSSQTLTLTVYNVMGQKVRTLVNGALPAGTHSIEWDGRDDAARSVASGVYVYRLEMNGTATSQTMILAK